MVRKIVGIVTYPFELVGQSLYFAFIVVLALSLLGGASLTIRIGGYVVNFSDGIHVYTPVPADGRWDHTVRKHEFNI